MAAVIKRDDAGYDVVGSMYVSGYWGYQLKENLAAVTFVELENGQLKPATSRDKCLGVNEESGFALGHPQNVLGYGARVCYAPKGHFPQATWGNLLYLDGNGGLDTAATAADSVGVARIIDDQYIMVLVA